MQQEYINDELKKGNADVRVRVRPIDMLPPVDEADAVSYMDRRKDRSKSKSKSPFHQSGKLTSAFKNATMAFSDMNRDSELLGVTQNIDKLSLETTSKINKKFL